MSRALHGVFLGGSSSFLTSDHSIRELTQLLMLLLHFTDSSDISGYRIMFVV